MLFIKKTNSFMLRAFQNWIECSWTWSISWRNRLANCKEFLPISSSRYWSNCGSQTGQEQTYTNVALSRTRHGAWVGLLLQSQTFGQNPKTQWFDCAILFIIFFIYYYFLRYYIMISLCIYTFYHFIQIKYVSKIDVILLNVLRKIVHNVIKSKWLKMVMQSNFSNGIYSDKFTKFT